MPHLLERVVRVILVFDWPSALVAASLLAGCGDPAPAAPARCAPGEVAAADGTCQPAAPPDTCAPGELTLSSGECQPAGLPPDMPCPPGELASLDGTCQAAGVPPEACAEGFEPDGDIGCNAILPAEACPAGQMAVPGETSCREVAPCGDAPWGTIPVEASTQFVDQAYAGGDSDGTMAKPWTTVQQGVDAAASGAIVAVTDGVYGEDVVIEGKAVRLWGRCPGRVEIRGTGGEVGAIEVFEGAANGAEIRSLAVTGVSMGIAVVGASDVGIDQAWVHGAGGRGIDIEDAYGPTSVTVSGSLIEQNHDTGVFVGGSDVELLATVVRSTQPVSGQYGQGICIQDSLEVSGRAHVRIRGCVVDQNHEAGVFVGGSDAELLATVVRSTQPANKRWGRGVAVQDNPSTGEGADVSVRGCVVEQNHDAGVYVVGSHAEIVATVVRSTQPVDERAGVGILIQDDPFTGTRADVSVLGCAVEQNHDAGVFVAGSDAEVEATAVRSTLSLSESGANGISVQDDPYTGARADVSVRGCVVEQNEHVGVFVGGSDAAIEATVVRSTQPVSGERGVGIGITTNPDTGERGVATIRACLVEDNHESGIYVAASDSTIEATIVRDTAANADGSSGDGIAVDNGTATIQGAAVSGNARAGVANWGSEVTVLATLITCNAIDLDGETDDEIRASFDGSADWQCSRAGAEDCAETDTCHVISASLAPPPPLAPLDL